MTTSYSPSLATIEDVTEPSESHESLTTATTAQTERLITFFDANGDLAILFQDGPTFVTCSRTLSRVSATLANHVMPANDLCPDIPGLTLQLDRGLNAGYVDAIDILMQIAHCQLKNDLRSLTPPQIVDIVEWALRWKMLGVLTPFAHTWTETLERELKPRRILVSGDAETQVEYRTYPSWAVVGTILALDDSDAAYKHLADALRYSRPDEQDRLVLTRGGIEEDALWGFLAPLMGKLWKRRLVIIGATLTSIRDINETLEYRPGPCQTANPNNPTYEICDTLICGLFSRSCRAAGVPLSPCEKPYYNSIADLAAKVRKVYTDFVDPLDTGFSTTATGGNAVGMHPGCVDALYEQLARILKELNFTSFSLCDMTELRRVLREQRKAMGWLAEETTEAEEPTLVDLTTEEDGEEEEEEELG